MLRAIALLLSGGAILGAAGCTPGTERSQAQSIAVGFVSDVQHGDGAAACALLTPGANDAVSGVTNTPCARAVLQVKERGLSLGRTEVWGDAAQVRVGGDVVFLRRLGPGWRVAAAGCSPRPPGPYKCDVEG